MYSVQLYDRSKMTSWKDVDRWARSNQADVCCVMLYPTVCDLQHSLPDNLQPPPRRLCGDDWCWCASRMIVVALHLGQRYQITQHGATNEITYYVMSTTARKLGLQIRLSAKKRVCCTLLDVPRVRTGVEVVVLLQMSVL